MHNEELHILYSSPDIIRQINSRNLRWAEHVARMGEERKEYKVLVGNLKERGHSEDQGIDGRMGSMALREIGCGGWGVILDPAGLI
jgi:hypothetical protein